MARYKPAVISKGSFAFCRTAIAALLWLSVIFRFKPLVITVFIIMVLSAVFKVERAPFILLYKYAIGKFRHSDNIIVDEKGIYVSHLTAAVFSAVCIIMLYFANPIAAWVMTGLFAVLQTSAAFGFCSALKLYTCMTGGNCCRAGRFAKKVKDNAGCS